MSIVLLGLPGAGKGTVAKGLTKVLGYSHLSTGEILREEIKQETDLGKQVNEYINRGELVPDDLITDLVLDKITKNDNIILDGFPRNIEQAKVLQELDRSGEIQIEAVVYLDVGVDTIFRRLRRRREIEHRPDDTDEVIQTRLDIAKRELFPMLEEVYVGDPKFHRINGEESAEKNVQDILKILGR